MTDDERPVIHLLTLDTLWTFAKHLYNLGDVTLLVPVAYRLLGWVVAIFAPIWLVLWILGVPTNELFTRFTLPGLLTWYALRRVSAGQRPHEAVSSWARWILNFRRWRPAPARCVVHSRARWSPTHRKI